MALKNPFPVYGFVYSSFTSENISNADVTLTFADGTDVTVTADSNGFYEIDIQDYANDGEEITFKCNTGIWKGTETYTLDISDLSHKQTVTLDTDVADLKVWYGDNATDYVPCYCSNWTERANGFSVEIVINKIKSDTLRNNTRPGAVDTKKTVGYGYMNFDATWNSNNTLRFEPMPMNNSYLYNKKSETTGYVQNLSIAPFGEGTDLFVVRIECVKANNTL